MTTKHFLRAACATSLALLLSAPTSLASILLSAEDFTVLGDTAITGTGVAGTVIRNGNLGLSPGATTGITGFPPAVIQNGAIIATGPVTRQARLDLIKVQVGLAGMPTNQNLSNVDLAGKTLRPGVYTLLWFKRNPAARPRCPRPTQRTQERLHHPPALTGWCWDAQPTMRLQRSSHRSS